MLGRLIFILYFPGLHEKLFLDHVLKNIQLILKSFLKLHNGAIYEAFMTFKEHLNIFFLSLFYCRYNIMDQKNRDKPLILSIFKKESLSDWFDLRLPWLQRTTIMQKWSTLFTFLPLFLLQATFFYIKGIRAASGSRKGGSLLERVENRTF